MARIVSSEVSDELGEATLPHLSTARNRALARVLAEIDDGLRHGYFEYTLTCEVIGHARRRLTLHAGKNHQFVIPIEDCVPATPSATPATGARATTTLETRCIVRTTSPRPARDGARADPKPVVAHGQED
jgi:hypothetical protein